MVQKPGSVDISAFLKKLSVFSTLRQICMRPLGKESMAKEVKSRDEAGGTKSADMDEF